MAGRATLRAVVLACTLLVADPAAWPVAAASTDKTGPAATTQTATAASLSAAAEQGVANAAAHNVRQSVAVIDRATGVGLADVDGEQVHNTESITKLFTAAYYLDRAQGAPGVDLAADLGRMIAVSDNDPQFSLWRRAIVPSVAERYGLTQTTNAPGASEENWGSDRTTANDMVTFLLRAAQDPRVGPSLLAWMARAEPTGSDGFDQSFGVFALPGDRGVKQGWSDPGWSPANLHSVGWTDRHFIAILQSSDTATYRTMRQTSTFTARLIAGLDEPAPSAVTTAPGVTAEASTTAPPDSTPDPEPAVGEPEPAVGESVPAVGESMPAVGEPAALGRAIRQTILQTLRRALAG
jgi:hypothetical protein